MVRVFSYLRITPVEGDGAPLNFLSPVWTVNEPVYTRSHRDHQAATNRGFAVYPLLANAGQVTVQARYDPQRALGAPNTSRGNKWYEDLAAYPGPKSIAAIEGQEVILEWASLAAPMLLRETRFSPVHYVDSDSRDPSGAPVAVDVVMTFLETDPKDRWL